MGATSYNDTAKTTTKNIEKLYMTPKKRKHMKCYMITQNYGCKILHLWYIFLSLTVSVYYLSISRILKWYITFYFVCIWIFGRSKCRIPKEQINKRTHNKALFFMVKNAMFRTKMISIEMFYYLLWWLRFNCLPALNLDSSKRMAYLTHLSGKLSASIAERKHEPYFSWVLYFLSTKIGRNLFTSSWIG